MTAQSVESSRVVPAHEVSIVIPVYRGERHLEDLAADIELFTKSHPTSMGHAFRVVEVILVHDCGPDDSARVIRDLERRYDWIRPVWLSRNFGQHAATLAGMASAGGEWIVTMDEDGQHDPSDIASLLDVALDEGATLVYARPLTDNTHRAFRRISSSVAKRLVNLVSGGTDATMFSSFRLMLGEVGRSVAAYAGYGIYLDVALGWVARSPATAPVTLRDEGRRQSGNSMRTLMSSFWRMVLTSGTRALRMVSVVGAVVAVLGVALAVVLAFTNLNGESVVQGWTSLIVVILVCTGVVLFCLGIIAEYLGVAVNMAMGKPLYLITGDPATGPLSRQAQRDG